MDAPARGRSSSSLDAGMTRRRRWFHTDEREDAVRSLEWTLGLVRRVAANESIWKWLILSLHNAAQGYMVVALEKGNGLLALRPKIARSWLRAFQGNGPYPVEKLDDFLPLFEKVKLPKHFATPFPSTPAHDKSIQRLNELRGYFTHFTPKGWSLELAGLPIIVRDTADLIEWAAFQSGATWHKLSHPKRTRRALAAIRRLTIVGGGRDA